MKKFFIFLFCTSLLSCSESKVTVELDNPTNEKYYLVISEKYKVNAYPSSNRAFFLPVGKHEVFINGKKEFDIELEKNKKYMLNPSLSEYYIEDVEYADQSHQSSEIRKMLEEKYEEHKTEKMKAAEKVEYGRAIKMQEEYDKPLLMDTIYVTDKLYIGRVIKLNKFLITKRWHYGTIHRLPNRIRLKVESNTINDFLGSSAIRCKIFRENDFILKVEKEYEKAMRLFEEELESYEN